MNEYTCRYCEHLTDVSGKKAEYIGKCRYGLKPSDCQSFLLAYCYDGKDPREWIPIREFGFSLKLYARGDERRVVDVNTSRIVCSYTV